MPFTDSLHPHKVLETKWLSASASPTSKAAKLTTNACISHPHLDPSAVRESPLDHDAEDFIILHLQQHPTGRDKQGAALVLGLKNGAVALVSVPPLDCTEPNPEVKGTVRHSCGRIQETGPSGSEEYSFPPMGSSYTRSED